MLDFYIIKDDQPQPDYPEQIGLEFAGGINDSTFDALQKKGILDKQLDYYSDFRLGSLIVGRIRQHILQKQLQVDIDIKVLLDLLGSAYAKQSGLIAYGD